jgi:hypothetical protein
LTGPKRLSLLFDSEGTMMNALSKLLARAIALSLIGLVVSARANGDDRRPLSTSASPQVTPGSSASVNTVREIRREIIDGHLYITFGYFSSLDEAWAYGEDKIQHERAVWHQEAHEPSGFVCFVKY